MPTINPNDTTIGTSISLFGKDSIIIFAPIVNNRTLKPCFKKRNFCIIPLSKKNNDLKPKIAKILEKNTI